MLADLMKVRKHRVNVAEAEVAKKRQELEQCEQAVLKARQALHDYQASRLLRENELYESVLGSEVQLRTLEEMKLEIQILRSKELEYVEDVLQATAARDLCETQLQEAKETHLKAVHEEEKLHEHRRVWEADQRVIEERKADLEIEELPYRKQNTLR